MADEPWNYHNSAKSPRRHPQKSPARPANAKSGKPKQKQRAPPAEPKWEPDHSAETPAASSTALRELLSAVSHMEQPLSADVQKAVSNAQKIAAVDPAKQLQSAASRLRAARGQLNKARGARHKMHESWAKFIFESVQPWNKHIEDFEGRDAENLASTQAAMEKYQGAEVEASKEAVNASELTADDNTEVIDDELMADTTPSIQDDLRSMVTTFQRIRERQADMLDDKVTNKPRIDKEDEDEPRIIGSKSLQPFVRGGTQT